MKYGRVRYAGSQGFSIVEMLVSILLGSALLALSFNLYFSTKKSEQLTVEVLNTQTEARNGMHLLRQAIEHAGYTTDVQTAQSKEILFPENEMFAAGQVIRIDGAKTNQSMMVRLQGDNQKALRACNGNIVAPVTETQVYETWYKFYSEDEKLMCQVYQNGEKNGEPVLIAAPVVAMNFRAFATTADSDNHNTKVTTSAGISHDLIKSVQVQLIVRSQDKIRNEDATSTIALTGFSDLTFNDRYLYVNTNQYFLAQNQ